MGLSCCRSFLPTCCPLPPLMAGGDACMLQVWPNRACGDQDPYLDHFPYPFVSVHNLV